MNRQGSKENPRGGIEWVHWFGPLTGYTANPIRGCTHDCKWEMVDGVIVPCYAKSQKERIYGPGTFEKITWHPVVLSEIKRHEKPAGIFIDSMSDMFGQGVKNEWIQDVIQTIADCPQHVFFSLTKNPSRFREFTSQWPANWLVGISYPPTFMFGKRLTLEQQTAWFKRALEFLIASPAQHRWVSIEPLSLDLSDLLYENEKHLCWAVIGAASDGGKTHQPNRTHFKNTLAALDHTRIFFKGNLDCGLANEIAGGWREEFPDLKLQPKSPMLLC